MVKAVKKVLYAVLGTGNIPDEELITTCAGVESLLHSRPISYQSADLHNEVPLTMNNFLHGQMGGIVHPEDTNIQKRWQKVQALISRVWSQWFEEYLPVLRASLRMILHTHLSSSQQIHFDQNAFTFNLNKHFLVLVFFKYVTSFHFIVL